MEAEAEILKGKKKNSKDWIKEGSEDELLRAIGRRQHCFNIWTQTSIPRAKKHSLKQKNIRNKIRIAKSEWHDQKVEEVANGKAPGESSIMSEALKAIAADRELICTLTGFLQGPTLKLILNHGIEYHCVHSKNQEKGKDYSTLITGEAFAWQKFRQKYKARSHQKGYY
eukprot:scaffold87617_cov61-Attheya_sp.AAC.5